MHCAKCGSPNPDNATVCGACGATLANPYAAPSSFSTTPGDAVVINNWLIPAIFSIVCCCIPFGIVSLVYASQVNGKLAAGDIAGAQQSADSARLWFWIAFGCGLTLGIIWLVLVTLGGILGALDAQNNANF